MIHITTLPVLAFEEKNRRIKFETLPGGLSTQVNHQKGTI